MQSYDNSEMYVFFMQPTITGTLFGGVISIICTLLAVLVAICCVLALWAWWIADLVIFANNDRDAGNGCPLKDDL